MSRSSLFGVLGAISGFLAVAAGPIAVHHAKLSGEMLEVFQTGARYQLIHAVVLVLVALAADRTPNRALSVAGWLFVAGQVLFPFGLYAFALTGQHSWSLATPVGGIAYLAAWVALAIAFVRAKRA